MKQSLIPTVISSAGWLALALASTPIAAPAQGTAPTNPVPQQQSDLAVPSGQAPGRVAPPTGMPTNNQDVLKIINDLRSRLESQESRIADQQKLLQEQKRQLDELNRQLQPAVRPPATGGAAVPAAPAGVATATATNLGAVAATPRARGYGGPSFADKVQEAVAPQQFHPTGLQVPVSENTVFTLSGNARAYWRKYGPIMWSGLEDTFGAEGNLSPAIQVNADNWSYGAYGNFQLNTPYDGNVLYTSNRAPYLNHFDTEPFKVDLLAVTIQGQHWGLEAGRVQSPYGSFNYQLMDNSRWFGPFIRSEIIGYRELGFIGNFQSEGFKVSLGPVNGTPDLKSNSAKGVVGRVAYGRNQWEVGASGKWSGHLGSEDQKRYQSFVGGDAIYHITDSIALSGEVMVDWHGLQNPPSSPLPPPEYSGLYSFYGLDVYNNGNSIRGVGYYVNLDYRKYPWYFGINYGSYFPEQINNAWHDETKNRGLLQGRWNLSRRLSFYGTVFLENVNQNAPAPVNTGQGLGYLLGLQFDL